MGPSCVTCLRNRDTLVVCVSWQSVGDLKLVVFSELAKAGNMASSSAAGGEKHLTFFSSNASA